MQNEGHLSDKERVYHALKHPPPTLGIGFGQQQKSHYKPVDIDQLQPQMLLKTGQSLPRISSEIYRELKKAYPAQLTVQDYWSLI